MVVGLNDVNAIPDGAVRIEYRAGLEASNKALFLVRNLSFRKEFFDLTRELNVSVEKQFCKVEVGQLLAYHRAGEWYRTYVIHINDRSRSLRLFFIDYGFCEDVPYSFGFWQPLPLRFGPRVVESQSYKITLYGLTPLAERIPLHENETESRIKPCNYWLPCHINLIKEQMAKAERVFFQQVFQEGEIKFGYIFVETNRKFYSLNDLLVEKRLAIECEKNEFERNRIPLLVEDFRQEFTFDQQPSVRKKIWPNASFNMEKEEWFRLIKPATTQERSDAEENSRRSSLSNYSSFSNTSDYDKFLESTDSELATRSTTEPVRNGHTSPIDCDGAFERTPAPTKNVDDTYYQAVDSDETSGNDSETGVRENVAYAEYQKESTMPAFFHMRDEILVVGNENHFKPVVSFNTALDGRTCETLRKIGVRDINRNQGYMIPAMLSGVPKDIILVDAPKSGKTVGCLMALVSLLRKSNEYKQYTCSPRSIYVLPYSARCEFVHSRCVELITGRKDVVDERECDLRVAVAYGRGTQLEFANMHSITRGCDILVCTPRCLLRLLENTTGFDLNKLEYAIFDEFHVLSQTFFAETAKIMEVIRDLKRGSLRRVFISNSSPEVKPMMVDARRQTLLVPCYLEAAIFVNFTFEILYKDDTRKLTEMKERLQSEWRSKVVVIMLNDEDVEKMSEIRSVISGCGKPIYQFIPSSVLEIDDKMKTLSNDISCGKKPVVLCTDLALSLLPEKIYDADCLIHYSLPPDMGTFRKRFSVILRHLQNLAEMSFEPATSTTAAQQKPEVVLYINSIHQEQFPRLLNIMSQLRPVIPKWVQRILDEIAHQRELDKLEVCSKLKMFGRCDDKKMCKQQRHVLSAEKDLPDPLLPRTGRVKIKIVHVYGPTHFRASLLQHAAVWNGEWKRLPIMSDTVLSMKMKTYFEKRKSESVECVRVGDLYAVQETDISSTVPDYRRVRVMKIIEEKPRKAVLKFVDTGKEATKSVSALCELPPQFASIPETTVDVFLCNLQPIDEDITWGNIFTNIIQQRINEQKDKNNTFVGNIQLVIGRSMWLDPLQCESYSKVLRTEKVEFSFSQYLIREKFALKNAEHLRALRQMCETAGFNASETKLGDTKNCNGGVPPDSQDTATNEMNTAPAQGTPSSSAIGNKSSVPPTSNFQNGESSAFKRPTGVAPRKLNDNTRRPLLYWKQNETSLTLIVKKNIDDDYVIRHDGFKKLYFEGKEGDTTYKFDEKLAHCFDGKTLRHKKSGVSIIIKMDKLIKDFKWSRLLRQRERVNWVKMDIESLITDDDSDTSILSQPVCQNYSTRKKRLPRRSLLAKKLGYEPGPDDCHSDDSSILESDTDDDQGRCLMEEEGGNV